jgi:hypothetical protein
MTYSAENSESLVLSSGLHGLTMDYSAILRYTQGFTGNGSDSGEQK